VAEDLLIFYTQQGLKRGCLDRWEDFANVRLEQLNKIHSYNEYLQKVNSQQYNNLIVRKNNLLSPQHSTNEFFNHMSLNNCFWFAWVLLILYILKVPLSFFAIFLLLLTTIFVHSTKIARFFEVLQK